MRKRKRRRRTKAVSSGAAQGRGAAQGDDAVHGADSRASGADAHVRGARPRDSQAAHSQGDALASRDIPARDPRDAAFEGPRHASGRRSAERRDDAGAATGAGAARSHTEGGSAVQGASGGGGSKPGEGRGTEPAGKGHRNHNHKHRHRRNAQARPLQGTDVVRSGRDRVGATGHDGRAPLGQRQGRHPGAQAGAAAQADVQGAGAQAGMSGRPVSQQSGHSGHQRFEQGSNPGGGRGGPQTGVPNSTAAGSGRGSHGAGPGAPHGSAAESGYAARPGSVHAGNRAASSGRVDLFESEDSGPPPLYAALDLGTNNCRLLIAQPTRPGQFRVVDGFSRIVRLGEGLAASGRLSEDAMNRSVEALKICAAKLGHRNIRRSRLIATEAARAAENGVVFMERVSAETGLELEIIDRETEARLAVSGCASLVGREARSVVLFDIGGGSSEIAVLHIGDNRSSRLANHITHWTSLPVGVVTLSERHGGRDVTPESFEGMIREVSGMLDRFDCPAIEAVRAADDFHLIGTSGTVTTLAGVHLDLPRYDRRRVDGLWLSDDEVSAMQARLLSWDFAARAANPCIGPDRADLVLAGCAILEAIRRRWPSTRMRVADRGLREGLLTDMMADDGVWRRGRGRRPSRPGPQTGSEEGRSS
ncbi:Ppx/GppA phosphatase family protein [Rhizobium quercicola]|uniref:Ppx/GppA phosphatase family protein n=1 Tax=Rhizobium quercicola TaxID=2901226 RepID=UPI0030B9189F